MSTETFGIGGRFCPLASQTDNQWPDPIGVAFAESLKMDGPVGSHTDDLIADV